jgi:hypothetical protein
MTPGYFAMGSGAVFLSHLFSPEIFLGYRGRTSPANVMRESRGVEATMMSVVRESRLPSRHR